MFRIFQCIHSQDFIKIVNPTALELISVDVTLCCTFNDLLSSLVVESSDTDSECNIAMSLSDTIVFKSFVVGVCMKGELL